MHRDVPQSVARFNVEHFNSGGGEGRERRSNQLGSSSLRQASSLENRDERIGAIRDVRSRDIRDLSECVRRLAKPSLPGNEYRSSCPAVQQLCTSPAPFISVLNDGARGARSTTTPAVGRTLESRLNPEDSTLVSRPKTGACRDINDCDRKYIPRSTCFSLISGLSGEHRKMISRRNYTSHGRNAFRVTVQASRDNDFTRVHFRLYTHIYIYTLPFLSFIPLLLI